MSRRSLPSLTTNADVYVEQCRLELAPFVTAFSCRSVRWDEQAQRLDVGVKRFDFGTRLRCRREADG